MRSCAGADVDDMVGGIHRILVMLDDDERVAEIAEMLQRRQEAVVVALMKSDARLIEDVEHAHESRADLRRKPYALRLAARERPRRTRER